MNSKDFAIGILSTTAAILFVGFLVINSRSEPAWASGMTTSGGDYVMTVGRDVSGDEELVYVIDGPGQKLIVYRFDSARQQIQIVKGIDLAELRQAGAQTQQPRGRTPGTRRRGP